MFAQVNEAAMCLFWRNLTHDRRHLEGIVRRGRPRPAARLRAGTGRKVLDGRNLEAEALECLFKQRDVVVRIRQLPNLARRGPGGKPIGRGGGCLKGRAGEGSMVRLVGLLLALASLPLSALAEKREALLIGNEAYSSEIGRLANPHNDIALLEQALKQDGFDVVTVRDASLGALTRAVNAYVRRLQA